MIKPDIQVCVGSPGRFYTFDLARQLEHSGCLKRLYTAYPKWKCRDLIQSNVRSFPWFMGPYMVWGWRLPFVLHDGLGRLVIGSFDKWMSSRLETCDLFHCLSSFGMESHQKAKERFGARTVCDRGSSHITFQDEILRQEHEAWGVSYRPIDPYVIDRELFEYEFCDRIVVPSTFAYRTFVSNGMSEHKLQKVPFGVDLEIFKPAPKADTKFRIIYVGTLSLRKGIGYLLEAVAPLRLPNMEVWLIGNALPEVSAILAKYRRLYRHFGVVPRTQLAPLYSQGSVFVIASVEEGFGLVQPQAMACGLPVIATANTGAEDLLDDGVEGFIVPIRNPAAIRERILQLYEDSELRDQMSRAALERVRSLGGWSRYGQEMIAAYSDMFDLQKPVTT